METNARIKFENEADFIDGCIEMGKTLDVWKSTAEEGSTRNYTLTPDSEGLVLGIFLEVTK